MSQNNERPQIIDMELSRDSQSGQRYYTARGAYRSRQPGMDPAGCMAPFVTLALTLICLIQFGLLAAIGFLVFYAIGALLGAVRLTKLLMLGAPANPWGWRVGNWVISFLLTVWLAGGFD